MHGKNVLFGQSRYGFISTKTKNALMPNKYVKMIVTNCIMFKISLTIFLVSSFAHEGWMPSVMIQIVVTLLSFLYLWPVGI